MKLMNCEKGAALPLALIIMLVLGLLGATLMAYSVAETKQVSMDENKLAAHYLARSGAHAVASYLVNNPDNAADYLYRDSAGPVYPTGYEEDSSFEVSIYGDLNNIYVESTGEYRGSTQQVILTVQKAGIFDFALFGQILGVGNINSITGDVIYSDYANIHDNLDLENDPIYDPDRSYPDLPFPSCDHIMAGIDLSGKEEFLIDYISIFGNSNPGKVICTSTIDLNNKHNVLSVNLGQSASEPLDVVVRTGEINNSGGTIVLNGYGRFIVYVEDVFDLAGNYVSTEPGNAFTVIVLSPDVEFKQTGASNFEGILYGPSVDAVFGGGTSLTGSVIAKTIDASGNSTFTYKEFDTNYLPFQLYTLGTWRYDF